MGQKFTLAVQKDSAGFYFCEVLELSGCHTQAKTISELELRAKEAILAYLESNEQEPTQFVDVRQIEV